jgi:hypothetical protein
VNAIGMPASAAQRFEIEPRVRGAVLADDLQRGAGHPAGDLVEGFDQPINPPACEDRSHEQHQRIARGTGIGES